MLVVEKTSTVVDGAAARDTPEKPGVRLTHSRATALVRLRGRQSTASITPNPLPPPTTSTNAIIQKTDFSQECCHIKGKNKYI